MTDDRSIYDAALRLLAVRARSCDEMRTRLLRKDFATEQVDELIDRLLRERLLDDTDFATEWVRSRHEHGGKGRTALRHELRTKGVAAEVIEGALAEIDTDDERVQAMRLVEKKAARLDAVDLVDRDDRLRHRRRLVAMLARRGFPAPMSIEIVDEALDALAHSAPH